MPRKAIPKGSITMAIDIGGTGLKSVALNGRGKPVTEFRRVLTPQPATPAVVLKALVPSVKEHGRYDRVSVGFPGVVRDGVVWTAHNLHPRWIGFDLAAKLKEMLGKPVRVVNDADMHGLGAVAGKGLEMVITLGTGIGAALFVNGVLVPNLELGHHPFRDGKTYEELLGKAALDKIGRKRWNKRLRVAIAEWEHLFNYDHLYLGGGNVKKLAGKLPEKISVFANRDGLLGGIGMWRVET